MGWVDSAGLGMSHAEFAEMIDPILKVRNFTRAELLQMTPDELVDTVAAIAKTEEQIRQRRGR